MGTHQKDCRCSKCCRGARGPAGPAGPPGPAASLISYRRVQTGGQANIQINENVLFNTIDTETIGAFTYFPTGEILIVEPGLYHAILSLRTTGSPNAEIDRYQAYLNGFSLPSAILAGPRGLAGPNLPPFLTTTIDFFVGSAVANGLLTIKNVSDHVTRLDGVESFSSTLSLIKVS